MQPLPKAAVQVATQHRRHIVLRQQLRLGGHGDGGVGWGTDKGDRMAENADAMECHGVLFGH